MTNILAGLLAAKVAGNDETLKVTTKGIPPSKGMIMPPKQWQKRKKKLSMQKASRKANRS